MLGVVGLFWTGCVVLPRGTLGHEWWGAMGGRLAGTRCCWACLSKSVFFGRAGGGLKSWLSVSIFAMVSLCGRVWSDGVFSVGRRGLRGSVALVWAASVREVRCECAG